MNISPFCSSHPYINEENLFIIKVIQTTPPLDFSNVKVCFIWTNNKQGGKKMKMYKLTEDFSSVYKKGAKFFVISDSEFIGVKSYVLLSEDLRGKIEVTDDALKNKFVAIHIK